MEDPISYTVILTASESLLENTLIVAILGALAVVSVFAVLGRAFKRIFR